MGRRGKHLSDEALLALADGSPAVPDRAQAHVRACDLCQNRTRELRHVRRLLQETAGEERAPGRDLVTGAVKRLRVRRQSISNVNEFFGLLVGIIAGFATLLSIDDKDGATGG